MLQNESEVGTYKKFFRESLLKQGSYVFSLQQFLLFLLSFLRRYNSLSNKSINDGFPNCISLFAARILKFRLLCRILWSSAGRMRQTALAVPGASEIKLDLQIVSTFFLRGLEYPGGKKHPRSVCNCHDAG